MISPCLLNVALHGLEGAAGVRYRATGVHAGDTEPGSPVVIRYADDVAVLCHSQGQARQVKARLAEWLAPRGLSFNEDKTKVVHLTEGFDFLGFNVRRYPGGKLLIKPSKAAVRRLRERLAAETRSRPASAGTQHSRPARPSGLLELLAAKVARAVLRGPGRGNALRLPDHHDIEVMDEAGKVLARRRLPEGAAGIAQLHALVGGCLGEDEEPGEAQVLVGIETDRGPWAAALVAAGYLVFPVNPLQSARFRARHQVSGAKSDAGDAHVLADMVRTDAHQLRQAAGDSPEATGVKVLARTHKMMIWERARQAQRLRTSCASTSRPPWRPSGTTWTPPTRWSCSPGSPSPARAARLTRAQVSAALKRAGRRNVTARATAILAALHGEQLGQPEALTLACAAAVRSLTAVIITLNEQVKILQQEVEAHFGRHPDAEIILSQPGLGPILGARVLAEFGDDPARYADGKARRNYAGTSPLTRASGKKKTVTARFVHNDRLVDALNAQAFSALSASPGARAFYDQQRAAGHAHNDALRRLANRLVGSLHGCLKTRTLYDEDTAWAHRQQQAA